MSFTSRLDWATASCNAQIVTWRGDPAEPARSGLERLYTMMGNANLYLGLCLLKTLEC
jgi:hypothetical protein